MDRESLIDDSELFSTSSFRSDEDANYTPRVSVIRLNCPLTRKLKKDRVNKAQSSRNARRIYSS